MITNRTIKDVMGGYVGSRTDTVNQYKKSENKWKKYLKSLKKQNDMIYSIANKSGSCREIKKINKIRLKASKKYSDSSSDDLESGSSLASNSSWDIYRRNAGCQEMKRLYHVVTDNLKKYKDQSNEAINIWFGLRFIASHQ